MIVVVEIFHQISWYLQEFLNHPQVFLSQIQIAHLLLFVCVCVCVCVCESHSVMSDCFDPMYYTVHGILQARILE